MRVGGVDFTVTPTPRDGNCFLWAVGEGPGRFAETRAAVSREILREPRAYVDESESEATSAEREARWVVQDGHFFEMPHIRAWCVLRGVSLVFYVVLDAARRIHIVYKVGANGAVVSDAGDAALCSENTLVLRNHQNHFERLHLRSSQSPTPRTSPAKRPRERDPDADPHAPAPTNTNEYTNTDTNETETETETPNISKRYALALARFG